MSSREIKENIPPKLLSILANEAKINIQKNKLILESIEIYRTQINEIKNIFQSTKEQNNNVNKKTKKINIITEYITKLNSLKNKYNKEIKKIKEKDNEYNNKLFDNYKLKINLETITSDNFILENTLQKLNSELSRYKVQLKESKSHNLFREEKRDKSIKTKEGEIVIYDIGIDMQRDMLIENRSFNKCINKNNYYRKIIKEKYKKIEILNNYIETTKKRLNKLSLLKKYDSASNIFIQGVDYKNNKKKNKNAKKYLEDENNFEYNKIKKKSLKKNNFKKIEIQHFNDYLGNDDDSNNPNDNICKDKNVNNLTFNQINNKNINLYLTNIMMKLKKKKKMMKMKMKIQLKRIKILKKKKRKAKNKNKLIFYLLMNYLIYQIMKGKTKL